MWNLGVAVATVTCRATGEKAKCTDISAGAFLHSNLMRYWAKLFSRSLVAYPAGHRSNPYTARAESQPAPEQARMGIFQAGNSKQPHGSRQMIFVTGR
jgi:hypothetical protein